MYASKTLVNVNFYVQYFPSNLIPMCKPKTQYFDFALNSNICLYFLIENFSDYSYNELLLPSATTEFQLF